MSGLRARQLCPSLLFVRPDFAKYRTESQRIRTLMMRYTALIYNIYVAKIIHLDMDCFYAAVEIRDNPSLAGKPVAVGGERARSVVTTCNYEARKFGVHSAMSGLRARQLCPSLLFVRPDFAKYRTESRRIRTLMMRYTALIEPLSLDEAYMDVTECRLHNNSATLIAKALKEDILKETGLQASAGVAPNKFLAKIASDWEKPNGLTVIPPSRITAFVRALPLSKIPGVGQVTQTKLAKKGWHDCADIQGCSREELRETLGKFGEILYQRAFGQDDRPVVPSRPRKSLSVEITYQRDLRDEEEITTAVAQLLPSLEKRLAQSEEKKSVKGIFVKVKFDDFTLTTKQKNGEGLSLANYLRLCRQARHGHKKAVRLLGIGVDFSTEDDRPRRAKTPAESQPRLI